MSHERYVAAGGGSCDRMHGGRARGELRTLFAALLRAEFVRPHAGRPRGRAGRVRRSPAGAKDGLQAAVLHVSRERQSRGRQASKLAGRCALPLSHVGAGAEQHTQNECAVPARRWMCPRGNGATATVTRRTPDCPRVADDGGRAAHDCERLSPCTHLGGRVPRLASRQKSRHAERHEHLDRRCTGASRRPRIIQQPSCAEGAAQPEAFRGRRQRSASGVHDAGVLLPG